MTWPTAEGLPREVAALRADAATALGALEREVAAGEYLAADATLEGLLTYLDWCRDRLTIVRLGLSPRPPGTS